MNNYNDKDSDDDVDGNDDDNDDDNDSFLKQLKTLFFIIANRVLKWWRHKN